MIGRFQWLLTTARLHAADPARRSAAGFVRGLPDRPHRAQVKRWENGQVALTHQLVRRYETRLELPEGQLLRAIDLLAREDAPLLRLPAVPPPPSRDVVADAMPLLEQALDGAPMSGLDWDRLTTLVGATPHVLLRRRDWTSLVQRLSLETAVSTRLEYAHRWEAAARIVSNPRVADVVVEMIEGALTDDDVQLYSDYATLLRFCPDPRGHDLLLGVVREPPNPRALWAAMSTLTTLVHHRIIDRTRSEAVLPCVLATVADEAVPLRTRRAAASLVDRLSTRSLRSRRRGPSGGPLISGAQRRQVDELLQAGSPGRARQQALLEETVARLVRETPVDADDPQLHDLLATALREPHLDVRDTALAVLLLSPQGRSLGDVLGDDLAEVVAEGVTDESVPRAVSDLSMLSWLVEPSALPLLTGLTVSDEWPELASLAAASVGNAVEPPGALRDDRDSLLMAYAASSIARQLGTGASEEWKDGWSDVSAAVSGRAVDAVTGPPVDRDRRRPGNAWGVSYALGMRGRFDMIDDLLLRAHPRATPEWHTSLTWWADLPDAIRPAAPGPGRDEPGVPVG